MKRHFLTGLKALAVSALAFAAVSCYDDSELWGELEGLEQRVAALEEKLNTEVSTLNSKLGAVETAYKAADADLLKKLTDLDAKLVAEVAKLAADLDAADGNFDGLVSAADLKAEIEKLAKDIEAKYTELKGVDTEILAALVKGSVSKIEKTKDGAILTFTDGSTLEVSSSDKTNNEGLVTVVDGKWAIVGADGKTTVLDALVHPDTELEFKVDPKTYEVFVTYNGEDWVATGVVVKDTETINIVTGFKEAKDYVVITVGGVDYKLPKVSTNSFDIRSGKVFFQSEQRKVVTIKQDGVVSSMLAKKPAGWEVELVDESLVITAPLIEEGGAGVLPMPMPFSEEGEIDTEGVIEVWAVTEDGKTIVGKLLVEVGDAPAQVNVSGDYETVSVVFESGYQDVMFWGACAEEDFDAEAIIAKMEIAAYEPVKGIYYGYDHATWNTETYMFEAEHSLADMLGSEPEVGKTYIIWSMAADMDMDFTTYTATCNSTEVDFIKQYVTVVGVEIAKPVTSWNNAELNVNVKGTDKFYLGVYYGTQAQLTDPDGGLFSAEMIANIESEFETSLAGALEMGLEGVQGAVHKGNYTGMLTDISEYMWLEITPGDKYTVFVLPIVDGKTSYSANDLHYKELQIEELMYGGTGTVTLGEAQEDTYTATNITFNSFSLPINFEGSRVYYSIWLKSEYDEFVAEFEADEDEDTDMLTFLMENLDFSESLDWSQTVRNITESPAAGTFEMNTEYMVAAFVVDAEGACSELVTLPVTTLGLPYTSTPSTHNVSVESVVAIDEAATAVFAVNGANAEVLYYKKGVDNPDWSSVLTEDDYDQFVVEALNNEWETVYLDEDNYSEGKVTVSDIYMGNTYDTYLYAFVQYADGTISQVAASEKFNTIYTPNLKQWIAKSNFSTDVQNAFGAPAPTKFILDFGVWAPSADYSQYYEDPYKTMLLGWDVAPLYDEEGVSWALCNMISGPYTIVPTDQSSGTISMTNMMGGSAQFPYSNFDGTSCTFDLSPIFAGYGMSIECVIECEVSDETVEILFN